MRGRSRPLGSRLVRLALWPLVLIFAYLVLCTLALFGLKFFDPPTTSIQVQRQIESIWQPAPYIKRYNFVPLDRISRYLQRAVVAAEDGRFYQHQGVDFEELQKVLKDTPDGRRPRGASTITQQLIKNLFVTTHRSYLRKGIEFMLAPAAEWILGKDRILELYLNVIEWGPGVYGAEAAAQYHAGVPASHLGREQSARLAAIIPSPLTRKPANMGWYSEIILRRMASRGW